MGFVLWKNHGNFVGNGAWEFEITEWQTMKDERHNIQILKLLQVKAIRGRINSLNNSLVPDGKPALCECRQLLTGDSGL